MTIRKRRKHFIKYTGFTAHIDYYSGIGPPAYNIDIVYQAIQKKWSELFPTITKTNNFKTIDITASKEFAMNSTMIYMVSSYFQGIEDALGVGVKITWK